MSDGTGGALAPAVQQEGELNDLLASIWHRIAGQVTKLIEAHDSFGFFQFNANLNPGMSEILDALSFVDFALTKFMASGKLEHDESRNAINSRQCILKIKELALALEAEDEVEYERIMDELRKQSKF